MNQVVEHLPYMRKTLNSHPSIAKKRDRERRKKNCLNGRDGQMENHREAMSKIKKARNIGCM
jgi:hypothetical protein